MAELIGDGYDWQGQVDEFKFTYRPMLSAERRAVLESFSWTSRKEEFARKIVTEHLITGISAYSLVQMNSKDFTQLWRIILGGIGTNQWFKQWESLTAKNLESGIILARQHPLLNNRTCTSCREWWYAEDGTIEKEAGQNIRRPAESQVACETNLGCPVGHHQKQTNRLSKINRLAVQHYMRCKASLRFPSDEIVARNAKIISDAWNRK